MPAASTAYPTYLVSDPRCIEQINAAVRAWSWNYYQEKLGDGDWNAVVTARCAAERYCKNVVAQIKSGTPISGPNARQQNDGLTPNEAVTVAEIVIDALREHVKTIQQDLSQLAQLAEIVGDIGELDQIEAIIGDL
jgi:hypothetical protein